MPRRTVSTRKAAEWRHHVDRQIAGNLTAAAYCRKSQLPLSTFRWWQHRLAANDLCKQKPSVPEFVPLPFVPNGSPLNGLAILMPGGYRIIVHPTTERMLLSDTIRLLRASQ